jgi:hypothetical protein
MFESPAGAVAAILEATCTAGVTALETAAGFDVSGVDGAELRAMLGSVSSMRRHLDALEAHALAALHDSEVTDRAEGLATSTWLGREAGVPATVAKQRLHVATQLQRVLPAVDAALSSGAVSWEHARVLAEATNDRNAEAMAAASPRFIDLACSMVFAEWRRRVLASAALMDPDGSHDPNDVSRNRLTLSASDRFMLLRGELTGDDALLVETAVNQVADELFRQAVRDHNASGGELPVPDRATLRASALVELCRRGLAVDLHSSKPPVTELTLHAHPISTDGAGDPALWWISDDHHNPLPPALADRLVCHATARTLTLDRDGIPLNESRPQHDPTPAQRRGLAARDGGCCFPGCGHPVAWADAHHLEHWPTGPTTLANLALLCRHHHKVAHRRGWSVTLTADGWTLWSTPGGRRFWGQRHHRRRTDILPLPA